MRYGMVHMDIIHDARVSDGDRTLYAYLSATRDLRSDRCHETAKDIQRYLKLSRSVVYGRVKSLVDAGYLTGRIGNLVIIATQDKNPARQDDRPATQDSSPGQPSWPAGQKSCQTGREILPDRTLSYYMESKPEETERTAATTTPDPEDETPLHEVNIGLIARKMEDHTSNPRTAGDVISRFERVPKAAAIFASMLRTWTWSRYTRALDAVDWSQYQPNKWGPIHLLQLISDAGAALPRERAKTSFEDRLARVLADAERRGIHPRDVAGEMGMFDIDGYLEQHEETR